MQYNARASFCASAPILRLIPRSHAEEFKIQRAVDTEINSTLLDSNTMFIIDFLIHADGDLLDLVIIESLRDSSQVTFCGPVDHFII